MAAAEYVPGETGLTVRLDQIRQDSLFLTQSNALLMAAKTTLSSRGISDSIKNTFFSIWIVVTEPFYIDSQSKKEILPVPYYEQGETPHCWAVATCMAMRYVLDDDFVKPWEIVSTLNIPDGLGGSVAYDARCARNECVMCLIVSVSYTTALERISIVSETSAFSLISKTTENKGPPPAERGIDPAAARDTAPHVIECATRKLAVESVNSTSAGTSMPGSKVMVISADNTSAASSMNTVTRV